MLASFDEYIESLISALRRKYNRHAKEIISLFFAGAIFALTFLLLVTFPFFPHNWIIFISSLVAVISFRSRSVSLSLFWLALSLSLFYQNAIIGTISFVLYPVIAGKFKGSEPIKQLIYLTSISLLFVKFEFFPVVLAGLTFGTRDGLKTSLMTFFTAFIICLLLPIQSIGHFAMDFNTAIIPNPKPPETSITVSALTPKDINVESFNKFFSDFTLGVASSQLIIGLFIGWILIGVIPAYVKEILGNRGHLLTLASLLASSYVPFIAVNFVYSGIPGFEPTAFNVVSLILMVSMAWLLSEIIGGEEIETSSDSFSPVTSQQSTAYNHQVSRHSQTQSESIEESEGSRIEALRRELERERGDKK